MKEDYRIFVVTRGRVNDQQFIESVPKDIRGLITICCHPGELEFHKYKWGNEVEDVIEYGADCTNNSMARDWVMKFCKKRGIKYAIQIDDNIRIASHTDGDEVDFKLKLLTIANNFDEDSQNVIYLEMFFTMLSNLRKGYGMVGISHRSGNNRKKFEFEENTRLFAIWGINVDYYFKFKKSFADTVCKQDFYMQLVFLTHGVKTICDNRFTFDKVKGANANGGCSIYRNISNVNEASEFLKKNFPDFVTIVDKSNNNWSNFGEDENVRKEVIVHWKKAYESSKLK